MSSTFLTRLRVGDILVDTKGVSRLYRAGAQLTADAAPVAGGARHVRDRGAQLAADRAAGRPRLAEAPGAVRRRLSRRGSPVGALPLVHLSLPRDIADRRVPRARDRRAARRRDRRERRRLGCEQGPRGLAAGRPAAGALEERGAAPGARSRDDYERGLPGAGPRRAARQWRVGIVAMGDLPSGYTSAVRDAVEPAGAEVDSLSRDRRPACHAAELASELDGTRSSAASTAPTRRSSGFGAARRPPARRGRRPGRSACATTCSRARAGEYRGLDAVVCVRGSEHDTRGQEEAAQDSFETG